MIYLSHAYPFSLVLFRKNHLWGIQCRFGERGVTTANHYDGGQNSVAMISGAKRYILSPPNQCSRLGIVTTRGTALYRHSLLNFGRLATKSKVHDPI